MRKLFQLILISLLSYGTHAQQISLVQDFGTNGLKLDDTAVFNGNLYFSTQEEAGFASTLYSVDINNNITPLYTSTSIIFNLVQLGNHVYFTATGTSGWAFYRIDSSGAVSLVSETNAPFLDAIVYNDEIYFSGVNGGADLYAYSEITNSFRLVDANFDYGMGVSGLIVHNGELYFRGTIEGSTSNRALFKTNGSIISQVVAFDSQIYQEISNPYTFISFGNELYFSAPIDASLNYQLFKVNTNNNQLALASTYYVVNNHIPFVFNSELYFTGRPSINSNSVYELLKQNELGVITSIPLETENGQIEVGSASFGSISEASDFYIVAFTSSVGFELFKINTETLELFVDYVPGNTWGFSPNYSRLLRFNNKLYLGGGNLQSSGLSTQLLELPEAACINTITINDNNFEAYLENVLNVGDGIVGNGLVCKEQIELITVLDISNQGVMDLTGLEAFTNLEILNVSNNNLNALELQNLNLVEIYANDCNLAGKIIRFQNDPGNGGSFLTDVTTLELQNNGIGFPGSTISFGGVPNVNYLDVSDNNFGTIQLNESTSIETLLANNCPNLTTLANLEALTNLESLGTSFSGLANLDVGQNSQLSFLNISGNTLSSLDLSNNSLLTSVYAGNNDLTTISLPTTTTLSELFVENNVLSALDVSAADQNLFDLDATGNPSLNCIEVSNVANAQSQGAWQIDSGTSFSLDCSAPGPFQVSVNLNNDAGINALEVTEGQTFSLNFNVDATAANGTTYTPDVTIFKNGSDATADFSITGLNQPITVNNGVNPDGSIQFTANDDGNDTGDQVYTITVASENTANYTIQTPETFVVTVTDALNAPILLRTTVIGATPNGNNYEILEGQTLEIQIEAINGIDGTSFTIPLDLSNTTAQSADYTGPETSFEVTVDTNANSDGVLTYVIVANDGDDAGEVLDIILDQPVGYQWEDVSGDGFLRIRVTINEPSSTVFTVTPSIENAIIIGDYPTLEITEGDTFNINFESDSNAIDGTEYQPQFIIEDLEFALDLSSDFIVNSQPLIVNSNNPDGFIELTALDDGENGVDREYLVYITPAPDEDYYFINEPKVFKIIVKNKFDPNAPFAIDIFFAGNYRLDDVGSLACCFWYLVEEGEKITINYNAEAQVPNGTEYQVKLNVTPNGFAPDNSLYIPFNENTNDYSFTENVDDVLTKIVNTNDIDGFTQLTIADNVDDNNALEYFTIEFDSENPINFQGADESGNFTFVIIEAPFAQFQTIFPSASEPSEEQPQAENGEVFFKVDNPNVEDIKVQFRLTGSATYLVDYQLAPMESIEVVDEEAQIFSILLNQDGEASVMVVPIDEDANNQEPEPTESVIFTMVDSFGYKVQEGEFAEVSILDTDRSTNFVFLADVADNNQLIYEDESRGSTSFFEVLLLDQDNNALTASEDILVKFSIQREDNQPITGVDYLIFDGNDNNKVDISQNNEFYVTINSGENRGLISVEALPDTEVEPQNERIQIQLSSGSNYEVRQIEKTASIFIVSEQRGDQFDPSQILATVSSPTCPGFNEGSISVANNTQFNFIAELLPTQENVPNQELAQDSDITFDELPVGEYEIRLTAIDNEEIIPPSFNLTIRKNLNSTQLLSSMVNSEKKEASLKVSGSKFYEVLINDKSYQHRFENDGPNEFNLPLQIGKNSIQIIGETQCQGIIDHEIFFTDLKIFPNPTNSIVHIDGLSSTNNLKLIFYDTTGKVVATFERLNQKSSNWEVNLESLSDGTYFCKIIFEDKVINTLKLIKN